MIYHVEFMPQALKNIEELDKIIARRILKKAKWLAGNFEDVTLEPLSGNLKGLFKLRIGDYRAIYSVRQQRIIVHLIGHRRDIYKK